MLIALGFFTVVAVFGRVFCDDDDAKCWKFFDVSNKTIIKTSESLKNGAKFLKSIAVGASSVEESSSISIDRRRRCARLCCETEFCNTVVLQEKLNDGFCYLFDCGPINDLKCTFSDHENHAAMALMVERGEIFGRKTTKKMVESRKLEAENHENDLKALKNGDSTSTMATKPQKLECTPTQWLCKNGRECIAVYDRCDGVAQCSDRSDENPNECKVAEQPTLHRQSHFRSRYKINSTLMKSTTVNHRKYNFNAIDENGDTLPPLERPAESSSSATVNQIENLNDFRLDYGTYAGDDRSLAAVMFGLGLAVLFLLLIFLCCRLRKIRRRRLRRNGEKRKMADLDEGEVLINGMYL